MGLFGFGRKQEEKHTPKINWVRLQSTQELDQLIQKESFEKPVLLFKHSTRCSISAMALNRMENQWDVNDEKVTMVYLDLIRYRDISNKIAVDLGVRHESPQVILVKEGKSVYSVTHSQIEAADIKQYI